MSSDVTTHPTSISLDTSSPRTKKHKKSSVSDPEEFAKPAKRQKIAFVFNAKAKNISAINNALKSKPHQRFPSGAVWNESVNHNDVNICSVFQAITARPPVSAMWKHNPCRSARPTWSSSRWSWAADANLLLTSTLRSGWSSPPITAWLGISSKRWENRNIL